MLAAACDGLEVPELQAASNPEVATPKNNDLECFIFDIDVSPAKNLFY